MYLNFYRLNSKPFQITTDPRFLWLGEKHSEALATLKYGILEDKGFLLLTDLGVLVKKDVERNHQVFVQSLGSGELPRPAAVIRASAANSATTTETRFLRITTSSWRRSC